MKVLIYTHAFAPSKGGVETYVSLLAEGLSNFSKEGKDSVEVTIATQTPAGGMDDTRMPYSIVRRPGLLQLTELIRAADVIHSAGPAFPPLALGWLFRKPVIVEHSGYQAICPNGMLLYGPKRALCSGHFMARQYAECVRCNAKDWGRNRSIRSLLFTFPRRWLCGRVAFNVAPSKHVAKRIALPRTEIISHGVPPRSNGCGGPSPDDNGRPTCFAYIGRLVLEKGVPVLLRAASRVEKEGLNFRLKIVGDGPERQNLEALSDRLGLGPRTEFMGALPAETAADALGDATAIVVPSVWEETAGLVAMEQMIRGRLVIASDIGGLAELVGDAALKFPAGDADALALCMKRVLENPEIAARRGKAAQTRALELFDANRMVLAHARMYSKGLSRS